MRIGLFWRVLPVYFVVAAIFVVPLWQRHMAAVEALQAGQAAQAALADRQVLQQTVISGQPVRILIPRLAIDLPIVPGLYDSTKNNWSVAQTAANYMTITALPSNKPDMPLIYGHATTRVFGPTKDLQLGDSVYVYTENGHILEYRYENKLIIKPTDVSMLNSLKGRRGLALMTCDGTWYENRRLMFFNLETAK